MTRRFARGRMPVGAKMVLVWAMLGAASALLVTGCATPVGLRQREAPPVDASQALPWSPADVFATVLDNVDQPSGVTLDELRRKLVGRSDTRRNPRVTSTGAEGDYACADNSLGVPQPYLNRLCAGQNTVRRLVVFGRENGGPSRDDNGLAMSADEFAPYTLTKRSVLARASAKSIHAIDISHDRLFEQANDSGHMRSNLGAIMLVSAGGKRITIVLLNSDGNDVLGNQTVCSIDTYTGN